MGKINRNLPEGLLQHLLDRIKARQISTDSLARLRNWVDTNPEVPDGPWFKRFETFILCGDGPLAKTFLRPGQAPWGTEVL